MRVLVWLFRALVFFILFAFALNNQQMASVRWFFGHEWQAPMVFVVLGAFALGCGFGVFAMVPSWWKHRRMAKRQQPASTSNAMPTTTPNGPTAPEYSHPLRDGL